MGELETPSTRDHWVSDVANVAVVRFMLWAAVVGAITVVSTVAIVREAEARAPRELTDQYLLAWGVASGGSFLLVALVGGLSVFSRETRFDIAGTWPLLAGLVVGVGYFVTLSAMGQTEPGTVACAGPEPCDTAFGFGAGLISVVAAILLGGFFIGAFSLKRLVSRLWARDAVG